MVMAIGETFLNNEAGYRLVVLQIVITCFFLIFDILRIDSSFSRVEINTAIK